MTRQEGGVNGNSESMDTVAVHGGERRPGPDGCVVFPIYQGTVYEVEPGTGYHDLKYIRLNSTPSQQYLHDKLAALEGAEAAVATSSGMAAVTTILLSLLRAGDHLLASDCLYGGTHDFLTSRAADLGWSFTFVDAGRPDTWAAARTDQTKVFLVETITNPLMRVGALDQVADFGRREGLVTVIDNTFASPVNFRPLQAGFDVVFHSATKYLGGHSDLVAGAGHEDPGAAGAGAQRQRAGAGPVPGGPSCRRLGELSRAGVSSRSRARGQAAVRLRRHAEPAAARRRASRADSDRRTDPGLRGGEPWRRGNAHHPARRHLARGHEPRGPGPSGHHRRPDPDQFGH